MLVLDGLEVLQQNAGDEYGLIQSADMRALLELLAAPWHSCFTLVTSRTPLLDLLAYQGYAQRDVERLDILDGRALLRQLGVTGDDAALDRTVEVWDGHALTLSLLAAYLAERHAGDIAHLSDLPSPDADEPRYQRVHRVLRRYDEGLGDAEQSFLRLFSAFRTPMQENAFPRVFRGLVIKPLPIIMVTPLNEAIVALNDLAFAKMLARLEAARLLRYNVINGTYTTHPLIRGHYYRQLCAHPNRTEAHVAIKDYYLSNVGDEPTWPTLEQLHPLIELVHHTCQTGNYDQASIFVWERIDQGDRAVLTHVLGAYETTLDLCLEFFPGRNFGTEPLVSKPYAKGWFLNEAGLALMSLGRLADAEPLFQRSNEINVKDEEWKDVSRNYINLANLLAHRGELAASTTMAYKAIPHYAEDKESEVRSLCRLGWALHLQGQSAAAGKHFAAAEMLERKITPSVRHLYSDLGICHATYHWRTGDIATARAITKANMTLCKKYHWQQDISQCHRLLGELAATEEKNESARTQLDEALKIARSISRHDVLIAALLARGRFLAWRSDASASRSDLDEALDMATRGGYRIFETDIRIALAWLLALAEDDPMAARASATRAHAISAQIGYHWGCVDAAEALEVIG